MNSSPTEADSKHLLPRLYERDIDVLLSEELLFSKSVRRVFTQALKLPDSLRITDCRLSVADASGETDVLATFSFGSARGVVLIENKIDAAFQPRQPERYKERVSALALPRGSYDMAFCVLLAPKNYVRDGDRDFGHFDAIVTYEETAAAIESEGTSRAKHRAALLMRAVDQARQGYTLIPAPAVTSLWHRIYRIASIEFPALMMKRPKEKGSNSSWVIFKADLPPRITLDWKIPSATVELSFWNGATGVPTMSSDLSIVSQSGFGTPTRHRVGETETVRISVSSPPAEFVRIDDEQIREALRAALVLLRLYHGRGGSPS